MKKTITFLTTVILAFAASLWTGCDKMEPVQEPQVAGETPAENAKTVKFTATLAGKGGEGTKSLDANGNTEWQVGERIAVYYTTTNGHASDSVSVTSVSNGVATIEGELSKVATGPATLVYPAYLHDGSGQLDTAKLFHEQYGNLTSGTNPISTCFDAAIGTGTITVDGENAGINGSVRMVNQLAICAFELSFAKASGAFVSDNTMAKSAGLTIQCAGATYQIKSDRQDSGNGSTTTTNSGSAAVAVGGSTTTSSSGSTTYRGFMSGDVVYVAMLPYHGTVTLYSSTATKTYTYRTGSGTLKNGSFYSNISVTLTETEGTPATPSGYVNYYSGYHSSTITLPDAASVTIENVAISASSGPAIKCEGDATITLVGSNTVSTSASGYPAIQAGPSGKTLTIQGSGSLTANGGSEAAGIGSGYNSTCGAITISGGTVTASGGDLAAGIGSGQRGTCGDIIISGGTVDATGGDYGAGIGSGSGGQFSSISITAGITSVTATMGASAQAPIGKGNGGQGSDSVTIDGVENPSAGESLTNLNWTVNGSTWTLTLQPLERTISGTISSTIILRDGANVTLSAVTANLTSGPAIQCLGNATITLVDSNTVSTSDYDYPAIQAGPSGTTLTIQGSGSLSATGGDSGAGIGGSGGTCGAISINGGDVTATGGDSGAGIGSGYAGICGAITISGGTVTATGGYEGAGIGSGTVGTCGDITISGGTVDATGGVHAAGIGSGTGIEALSTESSCGAITISGGTVDATGGEAAAGIGSGRYSTCGDITISGGTVDATGGVHAAGIGSGYNGSTCGNISIRGGTVDVTGGESGAGIGSGKESTCGAITISGGEVTAKGGSYGAGIGSGYTGQFSSISITSGITSVSATMGGTGARVPIGKGFSDRDSGSVTIDGVKNPSAGATLTNLNWAISTTTNTNDTWILTPKS